MDGKMRRFDMNIPPALLDQVNDWRRRQSDLPGAGAAIRRLIERGLQADALPAEAIPPTAEAAPISEVPDLSHVGAYPANAIAAIGANSRKHLNINVLKRLIVTGAKPRAIFRGQAC